MAVDNLGREAVLLTGGTGFAGRYAIRRLIGAGMCVCALVREKAKLLEVLKGDVTSPLLRVIEVANPEKLSVEELKGIIEANRITTVLHIAGIVGERDVAWERYFEVNVLWTRNLALAFLRANVSRNRFIFTSSVGVYGTIPKEVPAGEQTSYDPDGKYHRSKVFAEQELFSLWESSCLPLVVLRPTIMYGDGDTGFLFKFFSLMKKKRFPLCASNPSIHLLDVELLADVYTGVINAAAVPDGSVFNVADPMPVKMGVLCQYIADSIDAKFWRIPYLFFALLTRLCALRLQYAVSLKLISKTWVYDVDSLFSSFKLDKSDTIEALGRKYLKWYSGVLGGNG